MPHHSDGCVPRTVRSRSFKGGRQGVGPVACGDAWHVPGRIHSSMATAKTYQSPPMCLRKCACQYVLASVVQHRRETSLASPGCTIHALSRRVWQPLNYGRAPSTPCARNRAGAPKPKWVDAFQRSPRAFLPNICYGLDKGAVVWYAAVRFGDNDRDAACVVS